MFHNAEVSKISKSSLYHSKDPEIPHKKKQAHQMLIDIKAKIDQKIYQLHPNTKDRSLAWKYFMLILDENGLVIPNYYCCNCCKKVTKTMAKATSNFLKHPCVSREVEQLSTQDNVEQDSTDDSQQSVNSFGDKTSTSEKQMRSNETTQETCFDEFSKTYDKGDIVEKLAQKIYRLDAKRPAGISLVWQYFMHILDENRERIPNYYCCLKCMSVKQLDLKGPSKFLEHRCIRSDELAKQNDSTENDNSAADESQQSDSENSFSETPPRKKRRHSHEILESAIDTPTIPSTKRCDNFYKTIKDKIHQNIYKIDTNDSCLNRKSKVWEVFKYILDESEVRLPEIVCCIVCGKVQKYASKSTSNLLLHPCVQKRKLDGDCLPFYQVNERIKKESSIVFTEWILEDCQSVASVAGEGFKKVVKFLLTTGHQYGNNIDVQDLMPNCDTIGSNITKLKSVHDVSVRADLKKFASDGCGATADIWTDEVNSNSYLGVTVSFIKLKQLVHYALALKRLDNANISGANILEDTAKIFESYGIEMLGNKVTMVTDCDTNMVTAYCNRIPCISRLINSVLHKAMASCKGLPALLEEIRTTETKLQPHYKLEWHAYIDMMDYACKKWETVENDKKCLRSCILKLKEFLSLFKDVLESLEGSNNPTLHLVHPSIDLLISHCKFDSREFKILSDLKTEVLNGINTTIIPNLTVEHKAAVFFLPPANKLKTFTASEREITYSFVKTQMDKSRSLITPASSTTTTVDLEPTSTSSNFALLSNIINQNYLDDEDDNSNEMLHVNAEFSKYLTEKFAQLPSQFDILAWWDARKLDYPLLYNVSNSILAIPASAAACGDLFAKAQRLVNDNQSNIVSQNLNDNLLVCSNFKNNCVRETLENIEPEQ